jgi:hypothetical protein
MRNAYKILVGRSEGKFLGDLGIAGRIILEWILKRNTVESCGLNKNKK